ncbi:MAG TPA: type II secretion system protein N [Xanthobacteraceae bacterium]|nr:type II secretion system protein N [Xanthobacteraceae bacterium]
MSAATGLKRLGIAAGVVIVVGVTGLLAAPWLIPANGARGAVTAQIRAVTGLEPVVHGPVEVSLFPSGIVRLGDVVLGDTHGHAPPLAADRLIAHLRFLPLLLGRIEIADIVLDHPRIAVRIDKDGRSNWSPLLAALATALKPVDRIMSFNEIRVDNGTIAIEDASHSLTENLTKVDLSLAWPSISKSFGTTGHFTWRGEPVDASIVVGDFLAALSGDNSGLKIRLSGAPLRLAFEGTISSAPSFKADGTLSAEAASLRDALRWTGDTPVPGGGFGHFTLKGRANMVESSISLGPVNVELDGNAAEGALSYAADGQHTWQGTLAADDLDLTPYVSTIRLMAANAREWNEKPLALDGLSTFGLDLRLSAARLRIGRVQLGRTAVGAGLRDGKLLLSIIDSQAFNGTIRGSFAIARSHTGAEMKSEMHFGDVDLDSCLGELFGLHRLEGKGNLDFALEGSGNSVLELTHSLSGTIALDSQQGALAGINVEQVLRRLERRPLSGGDYRNGHTPYDKLKLALKVTKGTVTVDEASVNGSSVRVAIAGTASVPERDVDLKGTASLLDSANNIAFELPFVVYGPWDDATPMPDPTALLRRSDAAAPLLDAVRDRKVRDAVRSAIDRLMGSRKAPASTPDPAPAPAPTANAVPQ